MNKGKLRLSPLELRSYWVSWISLKGRTFFFIASVDGGMVRMCTRRVNEDKSIRLIAANNFAIFFFARQNWTFKNFLALFNEKEIIDVVCHGILWFRILFHKFSCGTENDEEKKILMWIKKSNQINARKRNFFFDKVYHPSSHEYIAEEIESRKNSDSVHLVTCDWSLSSSSHCWRRNFSASKSIESCGFKSFKFELHCGAMSTCTTNVVVFQREKLKILTISLVSFSHLFHIQTTQRWGK